jgi:uncharacterized metal-binding protein
MSESHETIHVARTKATCGLCEDYSAREASKPIVVMACEGACLRGELARLTANHLCDDLAPERTARLCLGGAFTKDTGQRNLARKAQRVIAIEGCPIACATRMMQAVVPEMTPEVFMIPNLTSLDPALFSIKEMPEKARRAQAFRAANAIAKSI